MRMKKDSFVFGRLTVKSEAGSEMIPFGDIIFIVQL